MLATLVVAGALAGAPVVPQNDHMNPDLPYLIANAPTGLETKPRSFSGKSFELTSPPIRSQYSQVLWHQLPATPLPADLVKEFEGKVMAFTGFEVDVIRNVSGKWEHVPCYESYNHHYGSSIHGKGADMEVISDEELKQMPNPHGLLVRYSDNGQGSGQFPTSQSMSEHNGNEARQTYHGLPTGYVYLIESPTTWSFGPMQINTRNPDGSGKRCEGGGAGNNGTCPLPRVSNAWEGADWSGMLECPCTTRTKKTFGGHVTQVGGVCKGTVTEAAECFNAAAGILKGKGGRTKNLTIADANRPKGCFAVENADQSFDVIFNSEAKSSAECALPNGAKPRLVGNQESDVSLGLDINEGNQTVTITMTVKDAAKVWFGVGFNTSQMDGAYAIIVDGDGKVTERTLHGTPRGGTLLTPSASLKVISQTSVDGSRTTVLQRAIVGDSAGHYSFSTTAAQLDFITAIGATSAFSQHKSRAPATMSLLSVGAPTCICRGGEGKINGFTFAPHCLGQPKSDLLTPNEYGPVNPTCDINLYDGGMSCCRGGQFLLDADQEIPALVDEVHFKWRWYYEEYQPTVHKQTFHLEWQFGHIEYSVPKALPGTPPESAVHTLTTRITMRDLLTMGNANAGGAGWDLSNSSRGFELIMMGFHCHSPACLGGQLFNADTGELLCHVEPVAGKSANPQDEENYLWLPPCQWGAESDGLRAPPVLTMDTNLTSVKFTNNSVAHYGVMAIWQGRGAYAE